MVDFAQRRRVFKGWDDRKCLSLIKALAHAVDPHDVEVTTTVLNPDGSSKACGSEPCPVEFGDLVLVELAKPFEIHVLGWHAEGRLPAGHQVRAQHGAWLP